MVKRRTQPEGGVHDGDADGRAREGRGRRFRRAWRRAVDGASELVGGVVGLRGPVPRPVLVPIPVRTTRQARRTT